jgi:uncharacterized protein (DUF433 family)
MSKRITAVEVFPGIVVDPNVCWGQPRINGHRIPAEVIADRYVAGETIDDIANDYGLWTEQVEAALRWSCLSRDRRARILRKAGLK